MQPSCSARPAVEPMNPIKKLVARSPLLAVRRRFGRRKSRVLLYHRVVGDDVDPALRPLLAGAVGRREFRTQMHYLARHYRVVPLAELIARRHEPDNRVAITFDDGYADNLWHALPVLKELGLPATVFAVADYVGTVLRDWLGLGSPSRRAVLPERVARDRLARDSCCPS
jgi:hypothetical protein